MLDQTHTHTNTHKYVSMCNIGVHPQDTRILTACTRRCSREECKCATGCWAI